MLGSTTILIVDESGYAAVDLSQAIEESDGCVAGPVVTLSEATAILDEGPIGGAIVDFEVAEALPLVMLLSERNVPLVVQISSSLAPSQCDLGQRASVLVRPVDPHTVLESLVMEMGKMELAASNRLGSPPKEV